MRRALQPRFAPRNALSSRVVPDSRLAIDERQEGEVTVLTLRGEVTLDDGDLLFRRHVHDLIDRGRTKVVADLGGVTYIDSAGVGMIVAKLKTLRERGGDLRLARFSRRSERLFGMMKLLITFETFADVETAVRSFAVR
jgi:anti-sigma B factor antagonist